MGIMYLLAFLRGDSAQMEREVAWGAGKPGDEGWLLSAQSDTEAYYGRLSKARDFSRRAADSALRAEPKEKAASWQVYAAVREAEVGDTAFAKQGVTAALALSPGPYVKVAAALALARIGDAPRATTLVRELEKSMYLLAFLRGDSAQMEREVAWGAGKPGDEGWLLSAQSDTEAYYGRLSAEFQKLLDHRGIVRNFVTGALARLQIARAYAMAGDSAKAKSAYQDFLMLWKDADPDIPILKQAQAEYAKLQ